MVKDLVNSVYEEYEEWLENEGRNSRGNDRPKGSSKGGKSSNKRKFNEYLRIFECSDPEGFKLKQRIHGKNEANLQHIEGETGATLTLLDDDPSEWTLHISGDRKEDVDSAVPMAEDLLQSVQSMYKKFNKRRPRDQGDDEPPAKRHR